MQRGERKRLIQSFISAALTAKRRPLLYHYRPFRLRSSLALSSTIPVAAISRVDNFAKCHNQTSAGAAGALHIASVRTINTAPLHRVVAYRTVAETP